MPTNWTQRGRQTRRELDRQRRDEEKSALTGKLRSDGSLTLRGDSATGDLLPTNKIYVRMDGLTSDTREVYAANIGWALNLWVIVKQDSRGRWTAIRLDDEPTTVTHGEQARDFATPASTGARPDRIPGKSLIPGSLMLEAAGTLRVNLEAFWYLDNAGNRKLWTPVTDNASPLYNGVDLSSSLPASGNRRVLTVDFNPDATTPALVVTTSAAVSLTLPYDTALINAELAALALPDNHLSGWGVLVLATDTTLTVDRFTDLRFHVGGGATGTGGTTGEYMLDDDGALMLDDDGYIMRDDG